MTNSPTWVSWRGMIKRCQEPSNKDFARYGGRGITVDPAWLSDGKNGAGFLQFLADMGERPAGNTLERLNGDKPYCKDNCVWATPKTQARNRAYTRLVEVDGVELTCPDAAKLLNLHVTTIQRQHRAGIKRHATQTPKST